MAILGLLYETCVQLINSPFSFQTPLIYSLFVYVALIWNIISFLSLSIVDLIVKLNPCWINSLIEPNLIPSWFDTVKFEIKVLIHCSEEIVVIESIFSELVIGFKFSIQASLFKFRSYICIASFLLKVLNPDIVISAFIASSLYVPDKLILISPRPVSPLKILTLRFLKSFKFCNVELK